MASARYMWLAVLGACLVASNAAGVTSTKRASVEFHAKIQSSALLQDEVRAFFAAKSTADTMKSMVPKTTGRHLLQGGCPAGQIVCDNICITSGYVCCNDGSGACRPGTQCVPGSDQCALVSCPSGQKICDGKGCISNSDTCCNDGKGGYCSPPTPVCDNNANLCRSAGSLAQAKVGMVVVSLAMFVLGMIMI